MIQVRFAALLAALTLVLVGCSDDDPEPNVDPTPSTSTTTTTSPTPDPTPTVAPLGPVETVKAWVKARNEALMDGVTTEVYALNTPDCSTCRDLVDPFAQLYADGGSIETDGWRIDSARKRPGFEENHQVIAALTFAGGHTVLPGEGSSPFPEEKHILQFQMRRAASGWLVAQVVFLP